MPKLAGYNLLNLPVFFVIAALGFALQTEKVLEVFGTNPNIVLASMIAVAVYFKPKNKKIQAVVLMSAALVLLIFLWAPFWLEFVFVIGVISLIASLVFDKMAGNDIVDGAVVVAFATPVFYLFMAPFGGTIIWFAIFRELVYNVITLVIILLFIQKITTTNR